MKSVYLQAAHHQHLLVLYLHPDHYTNQCSIFHQLSSPTQLTITTPIRVIPLSKHFLFEYPAYSNPVTTSSSSSHYHSSTPAPPDLRVFSAWLTCSGSNTISKTIPLLLLLPVDTVTSCEVQLPEQSRRRQANAHTDVNRGRDRCALKVSEGWRA